MSTLTRWIPLPSPALRNALEIRDVPKGVVDAILADRDGHGGNYAANLIDRANLRGFGSECESALGIEA
jgi:hypothetical protein